MGKIYFILGGGGSGKSLYAEQKVSALACQLSWPVYYIATAVAVDQEMQKRVETHRRRRPH